MSVSIDATPSGVSHSTWTPLMFTVAGAPILPSAGAFQAQDFKIGNGGCTVYMEIGIFQIALAAQVDLVFSIPFAGAVFRKPNLEQIYPMSAVVGGVFEWSTCDFIAASVLGAPFTTLAPGGTFIFCNRVNNVVWPVATNINLTIFAEFPII